MKKKLLSLALAVVMIGAGSSAMAQSRSGFGLTDNNQLFTIADINSPSTGTGTPTTITGMASGEQMVAIDYNQHDGRLYGLGYNPATATGQLYAINTTSFSAAAVSGSSRSLTLGSSLTNNVGFDFISTQSDMVRITGTNGYNYVMSARDGAVVSSGTGGGAGGLGFASSDVHSGATAALAATSYTNSYYGADAAEQVGYDLTTNSLVTFDQDGHTLHTIGISGVAATSFVGSDNFYDSTTHSNTIYFTLHTVLNNSVYTMNRATGSLSLVGNLGVSGTTNVRDIALQNQDNRGGSGSSSVNGQLMAALTLNLRNVIFFDSYNPGTIRNMISLSGMASGQTMMAIAYRPADRRLYGIGYNATTTTYQLYLIDTATGNVSAIGSAGTWNMGAATDNMGFAYNPVNDRIHITGNAGMNVELNGSNGSLISNDSSFTYASGDAHAGATSDIRSIAYTNGYKGANNTQMVGIDNNTGSIVKLSSGSYRTITSAQDVSSVIGASGSSRGGMFDYFYDSTSGQDKGYFASNNSGSSSSSDNYGRFYTMNTSTYSLTPSRSIGPGTPVRSITARREYAGHPLAVGNVYANTATTVFVYPNPVSSQARIVLSSPATSNVFVDVIDMNGRVARSYEYSVGSYQLDLDMSTVPVGLYNVRIQTNTTLQNVKVIKN
ncbi:MAG: DUF4394 domain-containing protein [Taibaiella sp.]|nr:DUF4394 domain-containing protein [Taibaiella sp.]